MVLLGLFHSENPSRARLNRDELLDVVYQRYNEAYGDDPELEYKRPSFGAWTTEQLEASVFGSEESDISQRYATRLTLDAYTDFNGDAIADWHYVDTTYGKKTYRDQNPLPHTAPAIKINHDTSFLKGPGKEITLTTSKASRNFGIFHTSDDYVKSLNALPRLPFFKAEEWGNAFQFGDEVTLSNGEFGSISHFGIRYDNDGPNHEIMVRLYGQEEYYSLTGAVKSKTLDIEALKVQAQQIADLVKGLQVTAVVSGSAINHMVKTEVQKRYPFNIFVQKLVQQAVHDLLEAR